MIAYSYDKDGFYRGTVKRQESPLEPGVWLMPGHATDIEPPTPPDDTKEPQWNGSAWDLVKSRIEIEREREAEEEASLTYEDRRRREYPRTDEMVVALWERIIEGRPEASEGLQVKRLEVKARHPKPEGV